MALERDDVLRSDFPVARKGYDPAAVDAHLRKVAKGVDELAKAPPPRDTAGSAAAGKVQAIVEAAENSADEIERQARADADETREKAATEAREHVERVSAAADEMRGRIDELERTLGELVARLRVDAGAVATDLDSLRSHVGEVRAAEEAVPVEPDEHEPEPVAPTPAATAVEELEDEVAEAETLVEEMESVVDEADEADDDDDARRLAAIRAAIEQETADAEPDELDEEAEEVEAELVEEATEQQSAPDEDVEGARITALGLAMSGKSREEITRELAQFNLSDPGGLADDVIAKVGR